jgi:hypothetical protein
MRFDLGAMLTSCGFGLGDPMQIGIMQIGIQTKAEGGLTCDFS